VDKRFPTQAVAFIKANRLTGNFFNLYTWGGYLVLFCPEVKTFIDGRTDIFEYTGVFRDYLDAEQFKRPLQVMQKYQVRYALLASDSPLAYLLRNNVGWRVVFSDSVSTIFECVSCSAGPPPAALPAGAQASP
jgi:hypothetical protein